MRKAIIKIHNNRAGVLTEHHPNHYTFQYDIGYHGPEISLTMPVREDAYAL